MTAKTSAYYDRAGRPISSERFKFLHADRAYIQVALTHVIPAGEAEYAVSTVWTGTDIACSHQPVVFETAVFRIGSKDCYLERYSSEAEASIGHDFFVTDIVSKLKQEGIGAYTINIKPWVSLIKEADK